MMAAATVHGTTLGDLLAGLADCGPFAMTDIAGVGLDSRRLPPGGLFLAVAGHRQHGLAFVDEALARGAAAIVTEAASAEPPTRYGGVPLIKVPGLAGQVSRIAGRFYGHPSRQMRVIGVTGTNGKTSVSHFIAQALGERGPCGLVGTLGAGLFGALRATGHTTPDAVTLQAQLAAMRAQGASSAVMEASSHALVQGRAEAVAFDTAVFTNLSHEHLDYHGDMAGYAAAKYRLFERPGLRRAVVNADDPVGREWLGRLPSALEVIDYGLGDGHGRAPCLSGTDLRLDGDGLRLRVHSPWGEGELVSGLLGRFNAYNLLAAAGALLAGGMGFEAVLAALSRVGTVPGRMERFGGGGRPLVVVDYAHTPDALDHVLQAARDHCRGRLLCVFGCGGERDREKRPLMGRIAERRADAVILTDDNPRFEDRQAILEAIRAGMAAPEAATVVPERGAAIAEALGRARAGDVVVVAGKGHESEQEVAGRRIPFSDRAVVARLLGAEVGHD